MAQYDGDAVSSVDISDSLTGGELIISDDTVANSIAQDGDALIVDSTSGCVLSPLAPQSIETSASIEAASQPAKRTEIVTYIVVSGDTVSSIAAKYGLKVNTVLWANSLTAYTTIHIGQELTILPSDGIMHKVASGQTLASIAKRYGVSVDSITAANNIASSAALHIGDSLFIPNGVMPAVTTTRSTSTGRTVTNTTKASSTLASGSHRFPYGQCTWYVATKRYVPWSGNAKNWLTNAAKMGFAVCRGNGYKCDPSPGSIMVTNESRYGHVVFVESVTSSTVTFSEMNYAGVGVRTTRTFSLGDSRIRGFIY